VFITHGVVDEDACLRTQQLVYVVSAVPLGRQRRISHVVSYRSNRGNLSSHDCSVNGSGSSDSP